MSSPGLDATASRDTRSRRLWHYVSEMFPLHVRVSINLVNFGFIYLTLQALQGMEPIQLSWISLIGAITVQLLWFFIRVYDELKDSESDLEFAKAGDARFQNRPLVTGKVKLEDIAALRWWMTAAIFALNAPFAFPGLLIGLLIAMGYLTLTYKWFFWPNLRNHVILVFITHIPNVLVIEIYTAAVFAAEYGLPDLGKASILLLALWATTAAYEFAYKIRSPKDETILPTYSKVLGWRQATWIAILFLITATGCTIATIIQAALPMWALAIAGGMGAWAIWGCVAFLLNPTTERANLTRYVGLYWYVACSAVIAAVLLDRGVAFVS